jgi:hypothetical protein
MALSGLPAGAVTVVEGPEPDPPAVVVVFDAEFDGEELQAASPRAPARTMAVTSAPERREGVGRMATKGSRPPPRRGRADAPPATAPRQRHHGAPLT